VAKVLASFVREASGSFLPCSSTMADLAGVAVANSWMRRICQARLRGGIRRRRTGPTRAAGNISLMRTSRRRQIPLGLVLVAALVSACADPAGITPVPSPRQVGSVATIDLEVGECFAMGVSDGGDVDMVGLEPCRSPHDLEVVGRVEDPAGPTASYRGRDAIEALASAACDSMFQAYVGVPPIASNINAWIFTPTATSWASGNRTVVCAAGDPGTAGLTGSIFGSRR
jgi:hypothetical protein